MLHNLDHISLLNNWLLCIYLHYWNHYLSYLPLITKYFNTSLRSRSRLFLFHIILLWLRTIPLRFATTFLWTSRWTFPHSIICLGAWMLHFPLSITLSTFMCAYESFYLSIGRITLFFLLSQHSHLLFQVML